MCNCQHSTTYSNQIILQNSPTCWHLSNVCQGLFYCFHLQGFVAVCFSLIALVSNTLPFVDVLIEECQNSDICLNKIISEDCIPDWHFLRRDSFPFYLSPEMRSYTPLAALASSNLPNAVIKRNLFIDKLQNSIWSHCWRPLNWHLRRWYAAGRSKVQPLTARVKGGTTVPQVIARLIFIAKDLTGSFFRSVDQVLQTTKCRMVSATEASQMS